MRHFESQLKAGDAMVISTRWTLRRNGDRTISACNPYILITRLSLLIDLSVHSDSHFSHPSVKPSNILVDAVSMSLLKGSTIDFATELIGSSFRVAENPQVRCFTLFRAVGVADVRCLPIGER